MATFNTYVKLGTRGNSLLSFNLSGCTTNNKNSCTALPDYQDVLHTSFDGTGLYVTGLTLGSTNFIYVEPNRMVSGHTCNLSLLNQMIPISGIPTPTPTSSPTPTPTPTPSSTSTPTPTPTPSSTSTPTPTPTPTPTSSSTPTPTPTSTTPTSTPISIWYQLTNCADSSIVYSEEYPEGQFAIDQKVTTPGGNVWVITNVNTTTNPGGTLYAITSTGFMGCEGVATFSTSLISASRSSGAGTTTVTSGTTITVTYATVTIKLSTWVMSGYRSDTTITVNGSSISPEFAGQGAIPLSGTGEGNASFTTFTLPVGVYTVTDWTLSAISDGSQTIVQAKLEQVI